MSRIETQNTDVADMQSLTDADLEQVAGGWRGPRRVTFEFHAGHIDRVVKVGSLEISRTHVRIGFPPV